MTVEDAIEAGRLATAWRKLNELQKDLHEEVAGKIPEDHTRWARYRLSISGWDDDDNNEQIGSFLVSPKLAEDIVLDLLLTVKAHLLEHGVTVDG